MKKSVIIPILLSLLIISVNLYAQTGTAQQNDSIVLISKKMNLSVNEVSVEEINETEKIVEYTLEDFEEVSPYKIIVYDIDGNEVFTLSSYSEIAFDKVPKNAKLLMKEGKKTFYIVDKKADL